MSFEGPARDAEAIGLQVVVYGSPDSEASQTNEAARRRRLIRRLRFSVPLAGTALVVDGVAGVGQATGVWVVVAAIRGWVCAHASTDVVGPAKPELTLAEY